MVVYQANFSSC